MKSLKIFSFFICFFAISSVSHAQQNEHQHTEHLDKLVEHYLTVKDALANDNFDTAQQQIKKLKTEISHNPEMQHHPEHAQMHTNHHQLMVDAINKTDQATNLKELRSAFSTITNNLTMALKNQEYDTATLFVQYCPMASGGEGATWISKNKEINNPYMGQKMLKCGVEREILNPDSK